MNDKGTEVQGVIHLRGDWATLKMFAYLLYRKAEIAGERGYYGTDTPMCMFVDSTVSSVSDDLRTCGVFYVAHCLKDGQLTINFIGEEDYVEEFWRHIGRGLGLEIEGEWYSDRSVALHKITPCSSLLIAPKCTLHVPGSLKVSHSRVWSRFGLNTVSPLLYIQIGNEMRCNPGIYPTPPEDTLAAFNDSLVGVSEVLSNGKPYRSSHGKARVGLLSALKDVCGLVKGTRFVEASDLEGISEMMNSLDNFRDYIGRESNARTLWTSHALLYEIVDAFRYPLSGDLVKKWKTSRAT